jgi:ANTAR domain
LTAGGLSNSDFPGGADCGPDERADSAVRTGKPREAPTADQIVSTVVGILMERYRIQRTEAYERLRRYSRTERRKVVEVATEIIAATEKLSRTLRAIESVARES